MTLEMSILSPNGNYCTEAQRTVISCTAIERINVRQIKQNTWAEQRQLNRHTQRHLCAFFCQLFSFKYLLSAVCKTGQLILWLDLLTSTLYNIVKNTAAIFMKYYLGHKCAFLNKRIIYMKIAACTNK